MDKPGLAILLQHGLANRLRTIIGYMYVSLLTEKRFVFHWDTQDWSCNGRFHDHFDAIPFATSYILETIDYMDRTVRNEIHTEKELHLIDCPKQSSKYYFIGQDTIQNILKRELQNVMPDDIQRARELYRSIIPKKQLCITAKNFAQKLGKFAALHIRRQDHVDMALKLKKYTPLSEFIGFVQYHTDKPVFLITDCHNVQQCLKKYDVTIFKELKPTEHPFMRPTSLMDAIIEMLICSYSCRFKGTGFSSFSELIKIWRQIKFE